MIAVVVLSLALLSVPAVMDRSFPSMVPQQLALLPWFVNMLAPVVAALCGACVFLADQRRCQYRFYAERGISPRWVWLSRHVVWLLVPLAAALVAALIWIALPGARSAGLRAMLIWIVLPDARSAGARAVPVDGAAEK